MGTSIIFEDIRQECYRREKITIDKRRDSSGKRTKGRRGAGHDLETLLEDFIAALVHHQF